VNLTLYLTVSKIQRLNC